MAFVKSTNSFENKLNFKRTSSFNKYFLCHYCNRKFLTKISISEHIETCLKDRTCNWCKIVFKNRGNLVTHAYYIHDDKSVKSKPKTAKNIKNTCTVCDKIFGNLTAMKYHVRRVHYNLTAKVSSYDSKDIDQVWYETLHNSEAIVEIKKLTVNKLLIRKCDNKDVEIEDCKVLMDLTPFYSTGNRMNSITCEICGKVVLERDFKKHYDEKHGEIKKHHCNNCNMTFKRSYFFIRHNCNKVTKRKRGKFNCKIDKVESLSPIVV